MLKNRYLLVLAVITLALAGCNLPAATPTDQLYMLRTAAAETVAAMSTQAHQDQATPTQAFVPTSTALALPSPTPLGITPGPELSPTATANLPCDQASFVSETIPDGTQFFPGSTFTKTWTLRNAGSCTWTPDYEVEYTSGNLPDILTYQPLTSGLVAPGETVTFSLALTAPEQAGNYRADFKLRNAEGKTFSFKDPEQTFWVNMTVSSGEYNLAENFCAADWTSRAGTLVCPGTDANNDGFVYADPAPILENGYQDDELALWIAPQKDPNGYIRGTFPGLKLPSGMKFEAVIGCASTAPNCSNTITLAYREGSAAMQILETWNEIADNAFHKVSVDLGDLAGRNIQLILQVDSHGESQGDPVHILHPVITP